MKTSYPKKFKHQSRWAKPSLCLQQSPMSKLLFDLWLDGVSMPEAIGIIRLAAGSTIDAAQAIERYRVMVGGPVTSPGRVAL